MYVPRRSPAAHQVAASQSSFMGCHVYLESGTDCRFWRYFFDESKVMLHACNGCDNVIDTVNKVGEDCCLGIIDNDFRSLIETSSPLPRNVFTSDEHDIEMMILKTEAARKVITRFDSSDKLSRFERNEGDLLKFVLGITDSIGLLKLVNKKYALNMVFKKVDRNQTFVLPSYEKFLDGTCQFISDDAMIRYLCDWSIAQKKKPTKSNEEIKKIMGIEKENDYDTFKLSCGHDVCYILAHIIKKRITNREKITQEDIENLLYVSYSVDGLKQTKIYDSIVRWSQNKGVVVLNV